MGLKHQYIDFRISRRTLWIGTHAYPLQNIARIRPLYYVPDRWAAIGTFVKGVLAWSAIGVIGWMLLGFASSTLSVRSGVIPGGVVLVMLVLHAVRLCEGWPNDRCTR